MTVLVTGATGFIGGHLVERLVAEGESVRALVRLGSDASRLAGAELAPGDLGDPAGLERAARGCASVYHLAGVTAAVGRRGREFAAVNVEGTRAAARAAAGSGARRLVLASSVSVYGNAVRDHRIREGSAIRPETPYGRSKRAAERALREVSAETGLETVAARIASVMGPRSRTWNGLFDDVAAGRLRFVGDGENHHHWVDVDDVVEGLLRCGRTPAAAGRVYTLAGPDPAPLRRLVGWIREATGGPEPGRSPLPVTAFALYGLANRPFSALARRSLPRYDRVEFFVGDRIFDLARARAELDWVPRVPIRESIARTARARGRGSQ